MLKMLFVALLVSFAAVLGTSVSVGSDGSIEQSTYTLRYFNARGRGEVIRHLFAISGTDYTDIRYNGRPEFEADRDKGLFPFHQVPVLEVDGVQMGQSHAIERFLASRFDLLGDDDVETALIDAVGEHVVDIMSKYYGIKYGGADDDEKDALFDDYFNDYLVKQIAKLEEIASSNSNSPFIVGDEISLADIQINVMLESLGSKALKGNFLNIIELSKVVSLTPGIKEWKEERPKEGNNAQTVYKLRYFDSRGRAEVIRHLFAVSETEYEDIRYNDPERKDFQADRKAGHFPYLQVPVLEVNGVPIAQSRAIERMLARKFDLLGGDELQVTLIEGVGEHIVDLSGKFSSIKYNRKVGDEEKEQLWTEYYGEYLPPQLAKLERMIAANEGSDYIIGDNLSLADIQINVFLESLRDVKSTLEGLPNLARIYDVVSNTEGIKQWKNTRPEQ